MEDFLATVRPRPADTGPIRGSYLQLFCASPNFVALRKICFKHVIKTKIIPPENVFSPQTLKPGYGPDSATIVSAVRIFCLKAIRPRDVA